jgi:hydroxymethylpyrimidine pyrophosphatase-like HAD family hydrolase
MIFHVLASDYDGTVAENGRVPETTARALARVRDSGRKLVLVTGRTLPDLERVCPELERMFDLVVAENGALLYQPRGRQVRALGPPPEDALLRELTRRGVAFDVGTSSIHTAASAAEPSLAAIRAAGVDRTPVFNRGALMLLPGGVTKGTGLGAALETLGISLHNTVGVGDAENDHAFLTLCEFSVAVADAVAALRERADHVTSAPGPRGVVEFIEAHLLQDVAELIRSVPRHQIRVGEREAGPVTIPAHGTNLLVVGPSGAGKSRLAAVLTERLLESGRSVCLVDPEGDYDSLADLRAVIALGGKDEHALPSAKELEQLLRKTGGLVLNLSGLSRAEKVTYGTQVLTVAARVRGATGMPHWTTIDEAHHLMPADGSPAADVLAALADGLCLITLDAKELAAPVRAPINAVASPAAKELQGAVQVLGWVAAGPGPAGAPAPGEMVLVFRESAGEPVRFQPDERRSAHRRHVRKYAEGELPPDRSFYFRGPQNALNLRAANLVRFREIAEGIDDATWEHHRTQGDYSAWIRAQVKDPDLARIVEEVEAAQNLPPPESRRRLLEAIRARYSV